MIKLQRENGKWAGIFMFPLPKSKTTVNLIEKWGVDIDIRHSALLFSVNFHRINSFFMVKCHFIVTTNYAPNKCKYWPCYLWNNS